MRRGRAWPAQRATVRCNSGQTTAITAHISAHSCAPTRDGRCVAWPERGWRPVALLSLGSMQPTWLPSTLRMLACLLCRHGEGPGLVYRSRRSDAAAPACASTFVCLDRTTAGELGESRFPRRAPLSKLAGVLHRLAVARGRLLRSTFASARLADKEHCDGIRRNADLYMYNTCIYTDCCLSTAAGGQCTIRPRAARGVAHRAPGVLLSFPPIFPRSLSLVRLRATTQYRHGVVRRTSLCAVLARRRPSFCFRSQWRTGPWEIGCSIHHPARLGTLGLVMLTPCFG